MNRRFNARTTLAIGILVISTWTLARLASKWDVHFGLWALTCSVVGVIVGGVANKSRGALLGGAGRIGRQHALGHLGWYPLAGFHLATVPKVRLVGKHGRKGSQVAAHARGAHGQPQQRPGSGMDGPLHDTPRGRHPPGTWSHRVQPSRVPEIGP